MPERRPVPGWGRNMLREIAAKQQMLPASHLFGDEVTDAALADLDDLLKAMLAVESGAFDGQGLRDVLLCSGPIDQAADLLRAALGSRPEDLKDGVAAAALGLAFVPIEWVDTVARHLLMPLGLKSIAKGIDPGGDLVLRTRLFMADQLLKGASLDVLLKGVSAMALLRENGPNRAWPELAHMRHRERLMRLSRLVRALRHAPHRFASTLRECLRQSWVAAERQLYEAMPEEAVRPDMPPVLADLFIVIVLPTCETIDAVSRIRRRAVAADVIEQRFIGA